MIKPSIGRVVLFHRHGDAPGAPPKAEVPALVCFVHSDRCINVGGFDENGYAVRGCSVPLLQDDDLVPISGQFARWMEYQKGQAAKTEALEELIQAQTPVPLPGASYGDRATHPLFKSP